MNDDLINDIPMPRLLTTAELAAYVGQSERTLEGWRLRRYGPPHITFGKTARYPVDALREWMTQELATRKKN